MTTSSYNMPLSEVSSEVEGIGIGLGSNGAFLIKPIIFAYQLLLRMQHLGSTFAQLRMM
jgi:hypothetical protein